MCYAVQGESEGKGDRERRERERWHEILAPTVQRRRLHGLGGEAALASGRSASETTQTSPPIWVAAGAGPDEASLPVRV